MPIYDQTFRRYQGKRSTRFLWWPVARQTLRPILKAKATYLLLAFVVVPVIIYSVGFFIAAQVEKMVPEQSDGAGELARITKVPIFGRQVPVNNVLFEFLIGQSAVVVILILAHGGNTVSIDKRNSALPLYFSRPLNKPSYAFGKILGLALLPAIMLAAALILIFAQVIGYFYTPMEALKMMPLLLSGLAYVGLLSLFTATSMVAFSSATKNANVAAVTFIIFWMLALAIGGATREYMGRKTGLAAISPTLSFQSIGRFLLDPEIGRLMRRQAMVDVQHAFAAIALYTGLFLLLIRRNLKVVEVVK
jgi:ABC-type transport system involved in multi-copper enzyme maturation permease subunit